MNQQQQQPSDKAVLRVRFLSPSHPYWNAARLKTLWHGLVMGIIKTMPPPKNRDARMLHALEALLLSSMLPAPAVPPPHSDLEGASYTR